MPHDTSLCLCHVRIRVLAAHLRSASFVVLLSLCASAAMSGIAAAQSTGLDWDGTTLGTAPSYTNGQRRMLLWTSNLPPPYPFTAMFKIYPRSIPAANNRFSANWFRGNSGMFQFGSGYCSGYYGWTEYPVPNRSSESKTEVSAGQGSGSCTDRVTRDNSSNLGTDKAADAPYTTYNRWYSRAITARFTGSVYEHKGYVDIGTGVGAALTVTSTRTSAWQRPPSDSIFMGQTGDNGSGKSWGGEDRWEESNAIERGIQMYDALLTPTQIQNRSTCDTDACVLAQCANDPPCPWYLNMNPTPTDVTDKSGKGHHGTWAGPARPKLWSSGGSGGSGPAISSVQASNVTTSQATIRWSTDRGADSQVEYGTTTAYGQATPINTALVTSHSMGLSSLAAGTTYHYRVSSRDASGNAATSPDSTFTTTAAADTTPPTISSVSATNVTSSAATIRWSTNEAADSQADYGTSASYGQSTPLDSARVTSHALNLTGLAAGRTYHFRVRSRDAAGNLATSADSTFATPAQGAVTASAALAAFSFNEAAGTTTADGSGNGFNGTLVNGPRWTSGHGGNALQFDGVDDRVTLPSSFDIAALPFTLEAWIYPTSASRSDWRAIFSKRSGFAAAKMRFDVGLELTSGRLYVTTYASWAKFAYVPPLNAWTHVAIVADTSATRLYVNGALRETFGALTLGTQSTAPVAIGSSGEGDDPFAGTIDDLRLYRQALTQGEIQTDMATSLP